MHQFFLNYLYCLLALLANSVFATANASELSDWMKQPGVVLLMRHAYAPGVGDPSNFKVDDCSTQRNLNQQGIDQAKKIGQWLTLQNIQNADVYTSPWCRCVDTAFYLNKGKLKKLDAIGSTFNEADYSLPAKKSLTQWMSDNRQYLQSNPTIMVTHQVNIQAYTGVNTSSGELVLIQVDDQGNAKLIKTYNPSEL
jgi:phosphohistidine phosphatase SixA